MVVQAHGTRCCAPGPRTQDGRSVLIDYVVAGAVACATTGAALAVTVARYALRAHHTRVAREISRGNFKLRRRMAVLAGRDRDVYQTVTRAGTMCGWVWILTIRRSGQPLQQSMGWAPLKWMAARSLARQHVGGTARR